MRSRPSVNGVLKNSRRSKSSRSRDENAGLSIAVDPVVVARREDRRRLERLEVGERLELSGTSQRGVLALLAGSRAAFSGGDGAGLDDYLAQVAPATARRIEERFARVIAAVEAIERPLESRSKGQAAAVERAQVECRALEILLKTEVASALGVTLTFKATTATEGSRGSRGAATSARRRFCRQLDRTHSPPRVSPRRTRARRLPSRWSGRSGRRRRG